MNKAEFIKEVASKGNMTQTEAAVAVKAVLDTMAEQMKPGKSLNLVGFGTFGNKVRKARIGKNPQTGESMEIPEANVPFFKPSKTLRE